MKENVQKQWRRHLCCGRFRLADNSGKGACCLLVFISKSSWQCFSLGLPYQSNPVPGVTSFKGVICEDA